MPKRYTEATEEVRGVLNEALRLYHPTLLACEVTFDLLMEANIDEESGEMSPSLKLHGYPCAAVVSIQSLKRRALGAADVLITIDESSWDGMGGDGRLAVIDHELEHVQVMADVKGGGLFCEWWADEKKLNCAPKSDDLGRPRIKLKLHDWQLGGFKSIAERHGRSALEVQAFRACWDANGQGLLFGEPEPAKLTVVR